LLFDFQAGTVTWRFQVIWSTVSSQLTTK